MKRNALVNASVVTLILVLLVSITIRAQDRSTSPAFPIGAGEKMLVIAGASIRHNDRFIRNASLIYIWAVFDYSHTTWSYQVMFPVGTTIKRVVVQAADIAPDPDGYLIIQLVRVNNIPAQSIVMRAFDTTGIASNSIDDFTQLVSADMNHDVLQGWTYWIHVYAYKTSAISQNDLAVSNVKIIYEP